MEPWLDSLKCCEIVESSHRSVMFSTSRLYCPVYRPRDRAYPKAACSGNRAVLSVVFVGSEIFVPFGVSARTLIVSMWPRWIMKGEWVEYMDWLFSDSMARYRRMSGCAAGRRWRAGSSKRRLASL